MRVIKYLFDFYLNSSIHVALAVCALVGVTILNFDIALDIELMFFVFFAVVTGYNFVKYFGLAKFYHRRLANWLKYIQIFSLLCFIGMCFYASKLPFKTLLYFGGLGIVTFFYAIPFLPKSYFIDSSRNLRAISGLKAYVIALVWSGTTVLIPLLNADYFLDFDAIISTLQIFIFVSTIMIPFDIYDLNYDSVKLATIPQKIGVRNAKIMGLLLLLLFFVLEFLKDNLTYSRLIVISIVSLISIIALLLSRQNQSKYFSQFWVEGIPIVWLVLALAIY